MDFDRVYAEHAPRLMAVCRRLMGDRVRAQEVLQTTFIRAWENADAFQPGTNLGAWLHRIAVNSALNELRRLRKWDAEFDIADMQLASPANDATAGDLRDALERALPSLPPRSRVAFVLHDIEGYAPDEIAVQMDISAATVRVHLFKARRLLRAALSL